jgi:GAF domain-containing protein
MSASEPSGAAALATLTAVARRLDAVARLAPTTEDPLLTAIAQTAATVLDAQAASIAVHDPERDRLVFAAAAGPAAGDVVGLEIDVAAGIAGYAFSTGQPLAIADAAADPRFDRTVAEATGYLPGSILAAPLTDDAGTVGVLEALDRRGGSFTLRDLDIAAALAREATLVVRRARVERDASTLLRTALTALVAADAAATPDGMAADGLDEAAIDALVAAATADLPVDPDDPTWRLADRIARMRDVDPESVALAVDWLDALLRRRGRSVHGAGPGR